jgi:signal transduction histidine kinase
MGRRVAEECPLAPILAERLQGARTELAQRWLERIADRVTLDQNRIFPTDELLDHVPLLIDGVAAYLANPVNEIGSDAPVIAKAMELGALRHSQGFDVYQLLKEYELLGGILFSYLAQAADEIPEPCKKSELLFCGQRVFRAVTLIQQATTMRYLRLADERVAEREDRLRTFNRTISHEIKNQIGTVLGASDTLLTVHEDAPEGMRRLAGIIARNARTMRNTVENLVALSRTEHDARQHRNVLLADAAWEAARQLRETAADAGVEIRVLEMPPIEVNAAAIELSLTNYLSNAIKYADRTKPGRFVEVSGSVEQIGDEKNRSIVVRARDNGPGVPEENRQGLFQRFFRTHDVTVTRAEGTGLGLSIVAETVTSLGGRAWAEFPAEGAIFAFSLPLRREDDGMAG